MIEVKKTYHPLQGLTGDILLYIYIYTTKNSTYFTVHLQQEHVNFPSACDPPLSLLNQPFKGTRCGIRK